VKYIYVVTAIVMFLNFNLVPQTKPDSGLIAYWPFNGNANDESGNNHDGGLNGGVLLTNDRFGNPESAYAFDGINGRIHYPLLWGFNEAPNYLTMAAWFNYAQTESEGKILYHGWTGEFQLLAVGDTAAGGVHLSSGWYSAHTAIVPNTWYFIVAIWEKGDKLSLYLDGILADTLSVPDEPLGIQASLYFSSIGSYNQSAGAFFTGMIDDIRIYDRALSGNEIDSLFSEGVTSVEEKALAIPDNFELLQNYPNPFNPTTKIKYQIPDGGLVSLQVYNLLGEVVTTLVNAEQPVGQYEVDFDATSLPNGIYFYKLQAGSFADTKKMILLK